MTKEEALSKVKGCLTDLFPFEEYDEVEEIIKALEQEPRWVPISKGLPKDNRICLVTVELTFARGERYVSQERKDNWDSLKRCGHEVIAWMPRPKPYKAESEE